MSVTAKVLLKHDRLAFVPTLRALDGVEISVIAQGTTDPERTVFPFYVEYEDRAELERSFDADETVARYELVDWTDEAGIYNTEYTPDTKLISTVVTEVNGVLAHTETRGGGWLARLLLPNRAALGTVWEYASENDIEFEIVEIYGNDGVAGETSYGLTDEQRATLLLAYERGYFSEPREVALGGIADELGLSSTATSGRLRRGIRNLVAATLGGSETEE
ncbi:MAG: putative DNA binding protein [uncultured archaeon A07HB70]|nr:MAG: putative DNA binding protein [uncultured archaeon A07HB70]